MLGSFIRHGLTEEDASRELLLNIVAGSDTSATSIRVMLLSLIANPSVYQKLQREIDDGIEAGRISSPITDSEARQMPYLQAAIKEALRIKPPVAATSFKTVPPEGDIIDGKFIPGGTQIGTSTFGIFLSKKSFGEDASVFRPERWLKAGVTQVAHMSSVLELVFSIGKY
jgi:cytochrome P450